MKEQYKGTPSPPIRSGQGSSSKLEEGDQPQPPLLLLLSAAFLTHGGKSRDFNKAIEAP